MQMKPFALPVGYVNAPSYDELVNTLELVRHATEPRHDDGAYHEAAHDLSDGILQRLKAHRDYMTANFPV